MNIKGVKGLSATEISTLKALGAIDEQQFAKVSEFIQVFRVQEMSVKCDRT